MIITITPSSFLGLLFIKSFWNDWHIWHCVCYMTKSLRFFLDKIRFYLILRVKKIQFHHHHHVMLQAQTSLTLCRHFSLSFIASCRSSGPHPVSSHSCWMYVRAGCPAFAQPYVRAHRSTSLIISSLLLQQWPAWNLLLLWNIAVSNSHLWVKKKFNHLLYLKPFVC